MAVFFLLLLFVLSLSWMGFSLEKSQFYSKFQPRKGSIRISNAAFVKYKLWVSRETLILVKH
ncbi:hypothetical protein DOE54_03030 [Vibrio cholerae]|nr:hypothetical protein B7937_14345 [Vibrio cholerae]RAL30226.1 hypothetical protein DOE54_03030 [Vibrio cholerae]